MTMGMGISRLTMVIKPVQGELNVALEPMFMHIDNMNLIHDDLIIANKTSSEHITTICEVMEAISNAQLTLNSEKCKSGFKEMKFWLYSVLMECDRSCQNWYTQFHHSSN